MFDTLLVANRGEIASRIIRTARAMGLRTVAVYSEPDARAPHVGEADQAVALRGAAAADTYLDGDALLAAAASAGAEAVHPGYGFLSENAAFATSCNQAGLVWVGPSPDVIASMGDKIAAKATMRAAGVPVLADAVVEPSTDLAAVAEAVGFPLLVKAAAGGGGKGMRLVDDVARLSEAVAAARREAAGAFGDDRLFLERFATSPRHVEVQILGDARGNLVHLGERECSVQRRHQKIIEESPSPAVDDALRAEMTQAALRGARALGYTNAGTVEFVLGADRRFHFLEVNTRLQVEHPVTELAWRLRDGTPLDLVRLQLLIAAGEALPFDQDDIVLAGHAVEARVYAEDPAAGFLPATGRLRTWDIRGRAGVRVDSGVTGGTDVSVHYDPLLAKVIATAPTRHEALRLLGSTLHDSRIHGVTTNREFLVACLRHPAFVAGDYTTDFLDDHLADAATDAAAVGRHALHAAAAALVAARARHRQAPLPSLPPGWRNNRAQPHQAGYTAPGGDLIDVAYELRRNGTWRVAAGDRSWDVRILAWPDETTSALDAEFGDLRLCATVAFDGDDVDVNSALGHSALLARPRFAEARADEAAGSLHAPMPGSVVSVHAAEGDTVEQGALLIVLEAMKMEHRVTAPQAGTVMRVAVSAGDPVATGDVLMVMDDAGE